MRILILGGNGMLGHKLFQVLGVGHEVFASFRNPLGLESLAPVYHDVAADNLICGVDASVPESVGETIESIRPEVVINCIGIIKQVSAANDSIQSITVNALFPHQLAQCCRSVNARLIHFSTDCVFSGRKGSYVEEDLCDTDTLYGRSKLLGELEEPGALTLRTSFIGRDFFKQVGLLEWFLSNHGGRVSGYRRVIYSGLTSLALARLVADLIRDLPALSGVYHVASEPISKYELLVRLARALELEIVVDPCDDPVCDRSLDANRFLTATGCRIPDWDTMIKDLAEDPTPYGPWKNKV